ncbi:kelch repeat and BTB domain-containing protein 2-like [Branchiostoma floridae]|uniref:Kelch repeat and BTB domain-containing protein 2-like n=1 Tax=Branchiostoma floridae TaxID=7739 RepID=A0A9J7LRL7_BRAFL|nr:kelch repeat and BTB domain-containing protein 2-like [Branchiostoma floridae]
MNVTHDDYPKAVLHGLNKLREHAELTDVVLEVGGASFPCHRAVLASCSPYFRGMFTSGYAEAKQERISIQDVSEVAMATILDYAYTGCLQMEPDQVQAVMSAARLLQVDFVCCKAAEYMKDHLDVFNCADVLMYADMLGDCDLVKASERYIASRFNQAALQPAFLQLPLPLLQSLLKRDDLITLSEDNVVQAALRWMNVNQEERLQHLPTLCRSFRRSFVSSKQLAEIKSKCLATDIKLVYSESSDQRLGYERTEMQIFLQDESLRTSHPPAPCYDPSTGKLYELHMPGNLNSHYSVIFTPDEELYLAGGIDLTDDVVMQKKFYQYNHLLNTWEPRCEMISPRVCCGLVYLKGYIYAIGGDKNKETAERYDPSCDEWTSIPSIPHPIPTYTRPCAVTLHDNIYVIVKEGCYCFSTTDNTWNETADILEPPSRAQAVTYQGCIYCIDCDKEWRDFSGTVEKYDPANGVWKQTGNGRVFDFTGATLMKLGGSLYLFTVPKSNTIYVHQYDPDTDCWMLVEDNSRLVPPFKWLGTGYRVDCLMARMIPKCLGDWKLDDGPSAHSVPLRMFPYLSEDDLSDQESD